MEILRPDPSRLCNEGLNINVYKILENVGAYDVLSIEYRLRSLQVGYRIFYNYGFSASQFKDFHHQKSRVKYLSALIYLFCIGMSIPLWMIDSSYYLFLLPLLGGILVNRLYFSQRWKANVLHVKEILANPENLRALMLIDPNDMEGIRLFAKKLFWIDLEAVKKGEIVSSEEREDRDQFNLSAKKSFSFDLELVNKNEVLIGEERVDMEEFRPFGMRSLGVDIDISDKDETLIIEEPEINSSEITYVDNRPTFKSIFLNEELYLLAIEKLSEYFTCEGRFIKLNRGKAYVIAILYALEYQGYLRKKHHAVVEIQQIASTILGTHVSVETAKFTERVIRPKYNKILKLLPVV